MLFWQTGSRFAWKTHSAGTGYARFDEPGRKDGFLESPDGSLHPLLLPAEMLVPMCVCRDYCISDSRNPHWLDQERHPRKQIVFQTIHAVHLAGEMHGVAANGQRALSCGNTPFLALRQHIARTVSELFDEYKSGMNQNAVPPLLTYATEEKNIHERDL